MNIFEQNQLTYDMLASEYDERAESLRPVTQEAVEVFKYFQQTGRILDIGSGAGLLVQVLAEYGYKAEGIDISPEMVKVARSRNPNTPIHTGNFLTTKLEGQFDGAFMFAFIHLYPRSVADSILQKTRRILKPGGVLYVGTTESEISTEGFESKTDYSDTEEKRYRKHWTREEFMGFLISNNMLILSEERIIDPYGKKWMDFIVRLESA